MKYKFIQKINIIILQILIALVFLVYELNNIRYYKYQSQ